MDALISGSSDATVGLKRSIRHTRPGMECASSVGAIPVTLFAPFVNIKIKRPPEHDESEGRNQSLDVAIIVSVFALLFQPHTI